MSIRDTQELLQRDKRLLPRESVCESECALFVCPASAHRAIGPGTLNARRPKSRYSIPATSPHSAAQRCGAELTASCSPMM